MRTNNGHNGSTEGRCADDKGVEESGNKKPAQYATDQHQESGHHGPEHGVQIECTGQRETDENSARDTQENTPVGLEKIGRGAEDDRAGDPKDDGEGSDVTSQRPAQQKTDVEADKAIKQRKPSIKEE